MTSQMTTSEIEIQPITPEIVTEFLKIADSEWISRGITRLEATVVDGKFQTDEDGEIYTLLRLAQQRLEEAAR